MSLFKYNRELLGDLARQYGFARDTLEKVLRLIELLKILNEDPLLKHVLALKGGTAINLTIFNLPRLSVDIDLDYTVNCSREGMMSQRSSIKEILDRYISAAGYTLHSQSKQTHALDSFVYSYMNSAGVWDKIKLEINYSLRAHLLHPRVRTVNILGLDSEMKIRSLDPIEIFGSKIVALLSRTAARDLYDLNNMVFFGLYDETDLPILRKCVIFYYAIGSKRISASFQIDSIYQLTKYKIKTDLLPVIRRADTFDLRAAQERVHKFLTELLRLDENEALFLRTFSRGEYRPELLFYDTKILERIRNHPMVIWKMKNSPGRTSRE